MSFRLPSLRQIAVPTVTAFALLAPAATAHAADTTPPVTVDDVPATYRTSAVPVTLSATDEPGGSGVATTVFTTGILPEPPTVLSPVYDPADKPVLANGEKISYFSVDQAGNAEPVKTSRAVVVAPATTHYVSHVVGTTITDLQTATSVVVGDVTGDGRPDLVTATRSATEGQSAISVTARTSDGTGWEPATIVGLAVAGIVSEMAVGDVTGDGHNDLVITYGHISAPYGYISVIARTSDGAGWEPEAVAGWVGASVSGLAVGDVTGDGRADLIGARTGSNDVTVIARETDNTGWQPPAVAGTAGPNARSLVVADVTGDGRPDLITANYDSDDVSVIARKSDNSGWESSATVGPTGPVPWSLAVADVTGDGRPDLITANFGSDDVSVIARKSDNSGWESSATVGSTGRGPCSLAVADVTGDGRPDLITANYDGHDVSVIARTADDAGWETTTASGFGDNAPYWIAAADVTGDGRPDLIAASTRRWILSETPFLWSMDIYDVSVLTAAHDGTPPVTADNVPDGYVAAPPAVTLTADDGPGGTGVRNIHYTVGTSPEAPTTASPTYDAAHKPVLADGDRISYFAVDHLGNAEAIKTSRAAKVDQAPPVTVDDVPEAYRSPPVAVRLQATDEPGGSGVATTVFTTGILPAQPTVLSPVYDPADKPTLADGERISYFSVDEVGNAETVKTSRAAKIEQAPPVTTDDVPAFYRTAAPFTVTLTAEDPVGGSGVAATRYTTGAVPETPTVLSPVYDPADKPALANGERISYFSVDQAGNAEAVKTSRAVVLAPATTHHKSEIAGTVGGQPMAVAAADVTGDGRPDLITANQLNHNVSVIARTSDGSGWEPATIAGGTGPSPRSVVAADVTGDGRPDLITGNANGSSVSVIARTSDGSGWEPSRIAGTTGFAPRSVTVADVTGDDRPDLITANPGDDNVSVIARNATGTGWEPSSTIPTRDAPSSLAVADANGDGQPDLVIAHASHDEVSVIARTTDGTGWENTTIAGTTGDSPESLAVADVTGDGRPDLVTANHDSSDLSVIARTSDGNGWEAASTVDGPPGSTPSSVAVVDVTGDGRPDLITANAGRDDVSVIARNDDGTGWGPPRIAGMSASAPYAMAVVDVTGDGRADMVTANPDTDSVSVLTALHDGAPPVTSDDVDGEWHAAPITVALTADDGADGIGVVGTYYTVGATPATPTTDSTEYDPADKPTLDDGEKISYFSVDQLGNAEAVKTSHAAKVDQTAPTTTDDVPAGYRSAPVPVTLTADDGEPNGSGEATTFFTTGAVPEPPSILSLVYNPAEKPVLADGERIAYFSVDAVGNAETVRTSSAAQVDPAVPDTTITTIPAAVASDPRPSVSFSSAALGGTFECAVDAGPFVPCASPFRPSSPLPDGPHEFTIRAISRAGVVDPTPSRVAFVVDTSALAPRLLNGPAAASSQTTASITFEIETGATAACAVDGATFGACTSPLVLTDLVVGDHEIRVVQTDAAGNVSPALRVAFTVTAEPSPPTEPPATNPPTPPLPTSPTLTPSRIALTAGGAPDRPATVVVGPRTTVGCTADHGPLRTCAVEARSITTLKTTKGKRLPAGTVLAQGTGSGGVLSLPVTLRLTAAARSVAERYPLGVDARTTTTGTTAAGATLTASSTVRILADATVVVPTGSESSTKLSSGTKKALARLARSIGTAQRVRCAAYTDDSRPAGLARKLTADQARKACGYLTQRGLQAETTTKGHGSSRPRVSNRTAKGRAKNRRLEITITL